MNINVELQTDSLMEEEREGEREQRDRDTQTGDIYKNTALQVSGEDGTSF